MASNVSLTCHYCDFRWTAQIYTSVQADRISCPRCGDKNKTIKDIDAGKIDTYTGSPPFPDKIDMDWSTIELTDWDGGD